MISLVKCSLSLNPTTSERFPRVLLSASTKQAATYRGRGISSCILFQATSMMSVDERFLSLYAILLSAAPRTTVPATTSHRGSPCTILSNLEGRIRGARCAPTALTRTSRSAKPATRGLFIDCAAALEDPRPGGIADSVRASHQNARANFRAHCARSEPRHSGKPERATPVHRHRGAPSRTTCHVPRHDCAALMQSCFFE